MKRQIQKIKTKKHGYKTNSFFRKDLDIVRRGLKNTTKEFIHLWIDCIAIFNRWVKMQISDNQLFAKIFG